MEPKELQIGESYVLPANAKLVVKPMGAQRSFVMLFHDASDIIDAALLSRSRKSFFAYRLFMILVGRMRHMQGNRVLVDIDVLAERFGVSRATLYRGLATLRGVDLLRKQTPKGWYAINPRVAWSGQTGMKLGEALCAWDSGLVGPYMAADGENDAVVDNAQRDGENDSVGNV